MLLSIILFCHLNDDWRKYNQGNKIRNSHHPKADVPERPYQLKPVYRPPENHQTEDDTVGYNNLVSQKVLNGTVTIV